MRAATDFQKDAMPVWKKGRSKKSTADHQTPRTLLKYMLFWQWEYAGTPSSKSDCYFPFSAISRSLWCISLPVAVCGSSSTKW